MAYYDALIAAWNSGTQPPAGITGTALTGGMTTAQKLAAVNAWTIIGPPKKLVISPSDIINRIVYTDLAALTQIQLLQLQVLLSGTAVDATQGSPIRTGIQTLFAGKTQTLANLVALVAPYDNPVIIWTVANGYPPGINLNDAAAAGLT